MLNHEVKWICIRRLEAALKSEGKLDYPQAAHDVLIALRELHHFKVDSEFLREEKARVWGALAAPELVHTGDKITCPECGHQDSQHHQQGCIAEGCNCLLTLGNVCYRNLAVLREAVQKLGAVSLGTIGRVVFTIERREIACDYARNEHPADALIRWAADLPNGEPSAEGRPS